MSGRDGRRGGAATRERPAPPEHPALRERRRRVARDLGRRRRLRALWALGALAALAVAWWAVTGPLLAVHGVGVSGYDRPDRERVVEALAAAGARGSILSPPRTEMRRAVAPFPWVDDITVVRKWPRALGVHVHRARPLAVGRADDGGAVLVSASGRVLEHLERVPALGQLRLPGEAPAVGAWLAPVHADALAFLDALDPALAARVRDLAVSPAGTTTARLQDGPELRLGRPVRLRAKATALELVLDALPAEDRDRADYIDLSVPEHPAAGGFDDAPPVDAPAGDRLVDTDGDGLPDTPLSTLYGDPSLAPPEVLEQLSTDG